MTPAFWFELLAPCDPLVASLVVGFACVGWDGEVYLTQSGATYLELLRRDVSGASAA